MPARSQAAGAWGTVAVACMCLAACTRDARTLTVVVALLPGELPVYREVLADFERASGRHVALVAQQYADVRRALAAESTAGSGTIDLVELDVYSLAPAKEHVAVLDPADLRDLVAALDPAAVRAGTIDGLRFLPHRVTWQALIYDHATLGEPPGTWEDLLAVARAHSGKIGLKGARYEGLTCDVLPLVWAAGGSGARFDDPAARAALELLAALGPHLHPQSETFKEPTIAEAMARGELVLHLNWPFAMSLYASQGLAPDPIRSAPLPRGPAGRATVLGGGYLAVPRSAPDRPAALALVRHLLSRDVQARLGRELGWFSARHDVPIGGDDPELAGFAAMREVVRPRPEGAGYPELSRAWQRAARAVAFGGTAPADALARAAGEVR